MHAGASTTPLVKQTSKIAIPECAKCGIVKKSGEHSCCARGAAWFNNCGDGGDSKFDHTWIEGVQACKSK